ncbi:ATP-dependent RNA helicase [Erythrobacteraceae bacterium CFH 75059]|uniref:RcnB family protein n=1 Tax=Qipengyuania thermophila TaxID=2509361 RepID=UPI001021FDFC|nr:RcnB family protein [Qipengyuania thermophila]TCD04972.1 ATP-dependent RNA helicase [Erythrobacteraceae bacterium CFH 75059]
MKIGFDRLARGLIIAAASSASLVPLSAAAAQPESFGQRGRTGGQPEVERPVEPLAVQPRERQSRAGRGDGAEPSRRGDGAAWERRGSSGAARQQDQWDRRARDGETGAGQWRDRGDESDGRTRDGRGGALRPGEWRGGERARDDRGWERDGRGWDRDGRQRDRDDRGGWRDRRDDDRRGWGGQTWREQDWRGQGWRGQGWNGRDAGARGWDRYGWRRDPRFDWYRHRSLNQRLFRPGLYHAPHRGWSYSRLRIGIQIAPLFYSSRYWINDPWRYRLPEVWGPYRWVRYYDDVLLVDLRSGEVVDVIYDFFW